MRDGLAAGRQVWRRLVASTGVRFPLLPMEANAMTRRQALWQFCRFVAVGVMNTGFSYLVYAAGLALGLHYVVANGIAMLTGIVFSFKSQGRLVFDNRNGKLLWRFAGFWICIWLFNVSLIAVMTYYTPWDAYTTGALALIPVTLLSFFVQKYLVFASTREKKMPYAD